MSQLSPPLTIAWRRKVTNAFMLGLCVLAVAVALIVLVAILGYIVSQGGRALNVDFFTQLPKPVGETGGGMANAIVGSLVLIAIAGVIGLPIGVGAGVYLAEYGRGRLATVVRFMADVLTGVPSIAIGLFAYALFVVPFKSFSAFAGGFALAIIMIPVITRTTEEMVRLVPTSLREGALALGIPRWKMVLRIVLPTALSGIVTGALLAVARVAGETAPLLFTAFGNQFFWQGGLREPIAALPLQIFTYAISPYNDWHQQAWAGSLVLVAIVLILSLGARVLVKRPS
ncbi:MAG TPA: phosphate ABC transporter permease PstA [Chloroflexota bacterium]|nr:phosphate ABC transporter permease PstA [Chloroflexota bacterium]